MSPRWPTEQHRVDARDRAIAEQERREVARAERPRGLAADEVAAMRLECADIDAAERAAAQSDVRGYRRLDEEVVDE